MPDLPAGTTCESEVTDEGYIGIDVHKAARICSTAQIEPTHLRIRERALAEVRGTLAAERVDGLLADGRAMSLEEAVECALGGGRRDSTDC